MLHLQTRKHARQKITLVWGREVEEGGDRRGESANSTCSFFGITRASTFALIKSESAGARELP